MTEAARFWLLVKGRPKGPFLPDELAAQPDFGPHSLVCPPGMRPGDRRNWRPARRVKGLSSLLPEPRHAAASSAAGEGTGRAEADANVKPLSAESAAGVLARRLREYAGGAAKPGASDVSRRINPLLAAVAALGQLVCVPIALLSKPPPTFRDPSLAPLNASVRYVVTPAEALAAQGKGRPLVLATQGAAAWGSCLEAGRFKECAASCRNTAGCSVPDAWEACRGSGRSDEACFDLCSAKGDCVPPAQVLARRCGVFSVTGVPVACRGFHASQPSK